MLLYAPGFSCLDIIHIKITSLYEVPDSEISAKEDLYRALMDCSIRNGVNPQTLVAILHKHPNLINCEYKDENGFYGTPLLLTCDRHGHDKGKLVLLRLKHWSYLDVSTSGGR